MLASDLIDGLEQLGADRHPVLDMIREPDGAIRCDRHAHADGQVVYLPRQDIVHAYTRYLVDHADSPERVLARETPLVSSGDTP